MRESGAQSVGQPDGEPGSQRQYVGQRRMRVPENWRDVTAQHPALYEIRGRERVACQ